MTEQDDPPVFDWDVDDELAPPPPDAVEPTWEEMFGAARDSAPTWDDIAPSVTPVDPGDFLSSLTPSQREAVTTVDGPLMMVAGPGSGKTRAIVARIMHLVTEGAQPSAITAVSFTRKAAMEIRERLEVSLGDEVARSVNTTTFHGLGARLVSRFASKAGVRPEFQVMDRSEQKTLINRLMKDLNVHGSKASEIAEAWSLAKRNVTLPNVRARQVWLERSKQKNAADLLPAYEEEKRKLGRLDFDDLVLKAWELLRDPEVRDVAAARVEHMLVDEYQDTDSMQHEVVTMLSEQAKSVAVVGDLDQSIYGWRGAEPEIFKHFDTSFGGVKVVTFDDNFRSTPEILDVVRKIIEPVEWTHRSPLLANNPSGAAPNIRWFRDQEQEAERVTRWVVDLLDSGVQGDEIAVLSRTHRQLKMVQSKIRGAKDKDGNRINFDMMGGLGFYESAFVKDIMSFFLLAVTPDDVPSFRRAIDLTPGLGPKVAEAFEQQLIDRRAGVDRAESKQASLLYELERDADDLVSLMEEEVNYKKRIGKGNQKNVLAKEELVKAVREVQHQFHNRSMEDAVSAAFNHVDGKYTDEAIKMTEDRKDIQRQLREDAVGFVAKDRQADLAPPVPGETFVKHPYWGEGIVTGKDENDRFEVVFENPAAPEPDEFKFPLAAFWGVFGATVDEVPPAVRFQQYISLDKQAQENMNEEPVQLSTIHRSKGREFEHVWVIGINDGDFPSSFDGERGPSGLLVDNPSEEDRRLMFVSASRAKQELVMSTTGMVRLFDGYPMPRDPSKLLLELEESGLCHLERPLPKPRPARSRSVFGSRTIGW